MKTPWIILMVALLCLGAADAGAETLSKAQLRCAAALHKAGVKVAEAEIARFKGCVKAAGRDKLPAGQSAAQCLQVDRRGEIARRRALVESVAQRKCAELPPFGLRVAATVNDAFTDVLRFREVFGAGLDKLLLKAADYPGATCQEAAALALAKIAVVRLHDSSKCVYARLRVRGPVTLADLRACISGSDAADVGERLALRRLVDTCAGTTPSVLFTGGCSTVGTDGLPGCVAAEARCGACLAFDAAGSFGARCQDVTGIAPGTVCGVLPFSTASVARQWDEEMLSAIRIDLPRPPIHARNLFHLSVAMWDAWAAYDATATQYQHVEKRITNDVARDRDVTISFAAYRVIRHRFVLSPSAATTRANIDARMAALGLDPAYTSTTDDTAAALGNRIAATVIASNLTDGANEPINYADPTYVPVNDPMVVKLPGTVMVDPNRWQPLALDVQIGQNGIPIPGKVQIFVGPQWGNVTPFALTRSTPQEAYLDPGPPPQLGGAGDALFKARIVDILRYTSHLTIDDGAMIDISPAGMGNNTLGTNDGHGYTVNPATGQPYVPHFVKRGDFARVLAEFWADGPTSETPPGHWNTLANAVTDHPLLERRIGGTGPVLDPLEWDVKLYFALNGALHDAAVQCWGLKRVYDYVRPISMIRYGGGLGQSSDPGGPSYHPNGLPLEPGLIEVITPESSAPGERHAHLAAHVGEIAVYSWPGQPPNPKTQYSGVVWVRAVDWLPYQRNTFVTPPFSGFTSGHSTYSRSAAELLTRFTGSDYFPGGLGVYQVPANTFLQFEIGPSAPLTLQWARYYDAADQAGISRLYGGIHVATDDFGGRIAGAQIGPLAFDKALTYFAGVP